MRDQVKGIARRRTIDGVERALLRVGPPWRMFGVAIFGAFTHETATASETRVMARDKFLSILREHAEKYAGEERYAAMIRMIESRIDAQRDEIPHIIAHERGTDLDFITPPDGADA